MNLEDARKLWSDEWTYDIGLINETVGRLKVGSDAAILDVGTGQGIMAISLAVAGYNVTTGEPEVDTHSHGHSHAGEANGHGYVDWRKPAKALGVIDKIKYRRFDAQKLPFADASFDAVFLHDALQHIGDRAAALAECIRVTKSRGLICIIEINDYGIKHFADTEGYQIDRVDPVRLVRNKNIIIDIIAGTYSNAYILIKT